jgi:hypothetical protein
MDTATRPHSFPKSRIAPSSPRLTVAAGRKNDCHEVALSIEPIVAFTLSGSLPEAHSLPPAVTWA